jgi:hypothetical protein
MTGRGSQTVPNELIRDWMGAVFISEATVEGGLAVLQTTTKKDFYKPVVADSQGFAQTASDQEFSMGPFQAAWQ